MKIEEIDRSALPSIEEGAPIFASREWASLYVDNVQPYGLFDPGNHLQGTFLLFHKQKLGAGYTITPPFAPHIGLRYAQPSEKQVGQQSQSKDVHRAIADFLRSRKDLLIELTLSTDEKDSQPYSWGKFEVSPRHTYLLDLERSEDELLSAMSPERRKNIRKAEEEDLNVVQADHARLGFELLQKTIDRQSIKLDKNILMRLLEAPDLASNRAMYICQNSKGENIAASLVVWDKNRTYYLIGGYDPDLAHQGGGALNLWQAIKDASARGNRIFDFEGSQLPEVERYFRGFGGELHTFFQIQRASSLGKLAKRVKG